MSQSTANLGFPFVAEGQAQKHVTVNETIRRLDAIVQITVESATTTAEPGAPSDGQTYIVPAGKTGANWAAFTNNAIGYYRDGAWEQITPREGWLAWVRDTGRLLAYDGSAWSASAGLLGEANAWSGVNTFSATSIFPRGPVNARHAAYAAGSTQFDFWNLNYDVSTDGKDDADHPTAQIGLLAQDSADGLITFYTGGPNVSPNPRWTVSSSAFYPNADNAYTLGGASNRPSVVYAASGTINTSDARDKTELRALSQAERDAVLRVIGGVGVYQWRDAVTAKGEASARLHCGVTAQAVREAFDAEGLDATRYGLFCVDRITNPETGAEAERLGVRYDQLFAMALGAAFDPEILTRQN